MALNVPKFTSHQFKRQCINNLFFSSFYCCEPLYSYQFYKVVDQYLSPLLSDFQERDFQLSRSFFQDISHPSSSLYHLLPPPSDTSVLSRLRTATRFTRPISRTKNYCSFINYALNHYQVPRNN